MSFLVEEKIGKGTFTEVYRAKSLTKDTHVVMKCYPFVAFGHELSRQKGGSLWEQIGVIDRLKLFPHPNIAAQKEWLLTEGHFITIEEYCC